MLLKFQNLSLISKVAWALSLLILFIWVVPSMLSYKTALDKYEAKEKELSALSLKHGISSKAKPFDLQSFKNDLSSTFSEVSIVSVGNHDYDVLIEVEKEKIDAFHSFIETISLRYLVRVVGELEFKEKDKLLEVKLTLEEL